MANRVIRTARLDDRFFEAIAAGQTITVAATTAGYSRRSVYDWRGADEAFRERWEEAVAIAIERLEAEADRRAVEGTLEPVYYQGEECGQVRRYSDVLLIFRLKALKPEKYRDRLSTQVTGASGRDLIPESAASPDRLAQALLAVFGGGADRRAAESTSTPAK